LLFTENFLIEYATENRSIWVALEESVGDTILRAAHHQLFTMGQCRKRLAASVPIIGELAPIMIQFLLGLLLALLPERFRRQWLPQWHGNLRSSAIVSGVVQSLTAVIVLIARYPRFVADQVAQLDVRIINGMAERGGDTAVRGIGIIFLFAYILLPLSMLLIYLAFEGVVRLAAAVTTGEVVGTLPLTLIDIAGQKWNAYYAEKKLGPRVPDRVSVSPDGRGYDLMIASCREKPDWNDLITISHNETLYEVAGYEEGEEPRRYVYLLRRAPLHKVVRGLHRYDPEEVMEKKPLAISH
jgi:hypothetical protein